MKKFLLIALLWPFFLVIWIKERNKKPEHLFDYKKTY